MLKVVLVRDQRALLAQQIKNYLYLKLFSKNEVKPDFNIVFKNIFHLELS